MSRMRASLLALCYVGLMYVLVIHLFVLWKWETSPEIDELFIEIEYDGGLEVVPETMDTMILNQTVVDDLKRQAANPPPQPVPEYQQAVDQIAGYHAKLMEWDSDKRLPTNHLGGSSVLLPGGNKSIETLRITSLLLRESLSEVRDPLTLTSALDVALKEFEGLSQQKMEVQWGNIHNLLFPPEGSPNEYPAKEKVSEEELFEMVCVTNEEENPMEQGPSGLADSQDVALYVQDDDLEGFFMELKGILQQRVENLSTYLQGLGESTFVSKTIEEAAKQLREVFSASQAWIVNDLEGFMAKLRAVSPEVEGETDLGHCVAEEDVSALVEEGLNALHRRGDLRLALLQKLEELDPESAQGLILDAVLDARSPTPEPNPSKTINVRRLLDTPLLRHSVPLIDQFSDWVRNIRGQVDDSGVGKGTSVVERILQVTGTVDVYIPAWIRKRLMRSKRGADLLQS